MMAVAVGCAILGGCSLMSDEPSAPGPDTPPEPKTRPPAAEAPPLPTARPAPPAPKPASAPPKTADPAELVGLGEGDVHRLLGEPAGERADGAARVQTYGGTGCSLDVVLFLDVSRGAWSVLSYDLTVKAGKRARAACYRRLRGTR